MPTKPALLAQLFAIERARVVQAARTFSLDHPGQAAAVGPGRFHRRHRGAGDPAKRAGTDRHLGCHQRQLYRRTGACSRAVGRRGQPSDDRIGESWADSVNSRRVPSATVVDASLRYGLDGMGLTGAEVRVNANNLFDKTYVASCLELANCYFGEERTVTATMGYKF